MSGFSITRRAAISAIDSFRHAPEAVELSIIASFRRVIQPLTSFRTSIPSLAKHTDHEISRFVFRTWETSLPTSSRRPLAASDPSVQHFRPVRPHFHVTYRLCVRLKFSITVWSFVINHMLHKQNQK